MFCTMLCGMRKDFGCTCCAIHQMESMKKVINIVIQINILISILTSVRTDDSALSYTAAKEQASTSRTLDVKSTSISSISSSISILSTSRKHSTKLSSTASSSLHNTVTLGIIPSSSVVSMLSSTMAVKQMSSSAKDVIAPTIAHHIGNNTKSSSKSSSSETLSEVLIDASSVLIPYSSSNLSLSTFSRSLTPETSSVNAAISNNSGTMSTILTTQLHYLPSVTINKSSDYSIQINESYSISFINTLKRNETPIMPSIHESSGITSMVVLNSTLPASGIFNMSTNVAPFVINSTVYSESMTPSQTFIANSSVPMSSILCPTTTIYINCSSDVIQSTSPDVINISTIYISPTANVSTIYITSVANSSTIYSTSIANVSTIYITPSSNATTHVHQSTSILSANLTSTASLMSNSTSILSTTPVSITSTFSYSNTSVPLSTFTASPSSSSYIISSAYVINPPITKCDAFLSGFTDAHMELGKCMLHNMHPMRVCSNCSDEYNDFSGYHKRIFMDCGQTLIYDYNLKYQVIPKMFSAQEATWKALECDKCYLKQEDGTSRFSKKFVAFIDLYVELNACFKNHTHVSLVHLPNNTVENVTYDKDICTDCSSIYKEMQEKYEYYGDDGDVTKWCADINVAVNETRHKWSNNFKCGHKAKDLESVIALTSFFCFLPIVFYVGAKLHADVRERKSANRYNYDSD